MQSKRVNIYDRLPEIYRIKDDEVSPPGQLKNFIGLFEDALSHIDKNIEQLYQDLFIETCRDCMIPYIGDLLGNSHLHGNTWTLRADTADTIALRRRKGTLIAIERLTFDLTQWGVHCRELRETLAWNQHLNHQRPDIGGDPPYGLQNFLKKDKQLQRHRSTIQGGTLDLREPGLLSLINTPFDPFAYTVDLKIPIFANVYPNLPNLAIFLWRIKVYQVTGSLPQMTIKYPLALDAEASVVVKVQVHPLGEPVRLFNTHRFSSTMDKPMLTPIDVLTGIDSTPAPIIRARLTDGSPAGNPQKYIQVTKYDEMSLTSNISLRESNVALQLHVPQSTFDDADWIFRGANLCAWEEGLKPKILNREIVIDPVIGRILIGVNSLEEGNSLLKYLLLTYAYGSVGPVGAHPISRFPLLTKEFEGHTVKHVNHHNNETLQDALKNIDQSNSPVIIEINDSMVHVFDVSAISLNKFLQIKKSLVIKAADNQRPIIKLKYPLQFRPVDVSDASDLDVRLEGLYMTRSEDSDDHLKSLISQVALNKLEIINCTLDPGGFVKLNGSISDHLTSIELDAEYGFPEHVNGNDNNNNNHNDVDKFNQTPIIYIRRSITGPIFIDGKYSLSISESIVDAGSEVINDDLSSTPIAISGKRESPLESWGPPRTEINNTTIFGRTRVRSINGRGNIWKNTLEVLENQTGCIKLCYFSGIGDRLPQNYGCVDGSSAKLQFTSENFGNHAYGQLANRTDFRIKERGPGDNEMGAYGFLEDAHKWRNISIRFREFMPVGVKPLLIPVT